MLPQSTSNQVLKHVSISLGAFLTLFFDWNITQRVFRAGSKRKHGNTPGQAKRPLLIDKWSTCFTIAQSIFSVVAGLIVEVLFMLFFVYMQCNWLKMSEYEAYWLTDYPLINISKQGPRNNFFLLKRYALIILKSKQTSVRKISNFAVNKDHCYKK